MSTNKIMNNSNYIGEALCAECSRLSGGCCRTDPANAHLCFPLSAAEWRRIAPYAYLASLPPAQSPQRSDNSCTAQAPSASINSVNKQNIYSETTSDTPVSSQPEIGATMQHRPVLPPLAPSVPAPTNGDTICVAENNNEDFLKAMCSLFPGEEKIIRATFTAKAKHLRLRTLTDGSCVFQGREGCRLPRGVRPWYCLLFPGWVQRNTVTFFIAEKCLAAERSKSPDKGLRLLRVTPKEVFRLYDALREDWGLPLQVLRKH